MIINTILLCLTDQLMSWYELVDKIGCSWCFRIFYLWFWFIDFNMIVWNCLRGFTPHAVRNIFVYVTPWNIYNCKLMFNCIYLVIWLYGWLEWFEVWLELVVYEFLDVDAEFCGVLWTKLKLWDFRIFPNLSH